MKKATKLMYFPPSPPLVRPLSITLPPDLYGVGRHCLFPCSCPDALIASLFGWQRGFFLLVEP